jgi:hypothetical protein
MLWLRTCGATVFIPVGHTPSDYDLIADFGDGAVRVQVKTSTCWRNRRWNVTLATRGGNRSWSGLVKRFDASRCDRLFVHVGDGRRWFIPVSAVSCGTGILLGGPKYAEFEVDPGEPLQSRSPIALEPLPATAD